MKYCSKCGKELMDEATICNGCGCPVAGAPAQNYQNNQPYQAYPNYQNNQPYQNPQGYQGYQNNQAYPNYQNNQPYQAYPNYQNNQPYQGYPNYQNKPAETSGLATGAVVCAILLPIVGLILGIIGTAKYTDPKLKQRFTAAIFISIGVWILNFLILMVLSQL